MIETQASFPLLITSELEAIKQFYETMFGFNAVFYEPTFYLHLISPSSGDQLGFMMPNHPSQPEFLHTPMAPEGYLTTFEVKSAAEAYAQAQEMKLDFELPLKEEPWGQIHFIIRDPGGFLVDVVEHLEATGN